MAALVMLLAVCAGSAFAGTTSSSTNQQLSGEQLTTAALGVAATSYGDPQATVVDVTRMAQWQGLFINPGSAICLPHGEIAPQLQQY
jgi:hypothetical protein